MWPNNPTKYDLVQRVLAPSDADRRDRRLTYWQTDVKNLHFTYALLKYASDRRYLLGEKYFERGKTTFKDYGLLDEHFHPTESGFAFIGAVETLLAQKPALFEDDVNPFELEYLLHRLLYENGARTAYNSIEKIFEVLPSLRVEDFDSIVTLVRINNSDQTLKHFGALSTEAKNQLYGELDELLKDLKENGGLHAVKDHVRPEWQPFLEVLSRGALGHQGDGYYRAAQLLKAQLLLKVRVRLQTNGPSTLEELYDPFRKNISKRSFAGLLRLDSQIKEIEGQYLFSMDEASLASRTLTEDESQFAEEMEMQRIEAQTVEFTEEERTRRILGRLQAAERAPIITVPAGAGHQRTHEVRHVRNPQTSAAMRLYFKNVCQLCGFDGATEYGVGFSEVDHALDEIADTQNNRPSNLVVLCPNCHEAKTRGVIVFSDGGDHFITTNAHTDQAKNIPKFIP